MLLQTIHKIAFVQITHKILPKIYRPGAVKNPQLLQNSDRHDPPPGLECHTKINQQNLHAVKSIDVCQHSQLFSAELELCQDIVKELLQKIQRERYKTIYQEYTGKFVVLQGLIEQMICYENLLNGQPRKRPNISQTPPKVTQNKQSLFSLNNIKPFQPQSPAPQAPTYNLANVTKANNTLYPNFQANIKSVPSQPIICKICQKKLDSMLEQQKYTSLPLCWHKFCKNCLNKYIYDNYPGRTGDLVCPVKDCKKSISQSQVKRIVGADQYQKLQRMSIKAKFNIVQCMWCKYKFQFVPEVMDRVPKIDRNYRYMAQTARTHFANNRFVCPNSLCNTQQCKNCKQSPYHLGQSCQQFKIGSQVSNKVTQKHKYCRVCESKLTKQNISNTPHEALEDICKADKCQVAARDMCCKMLKCGHGCGGVRGETNCLPCMKVECLKDRVVDPKETDKCKICQTEKLGAAACVRSACGHIYHQKCLKKRYTERWKNTRINFSFCLCPICKKWINLPKQSKLASYSTVNMDLFNKIQSLSIQRLRFEGNNNDRCLTNPASQFFKNQYTYSMALYCYFECSKCKLPYFGGVRNPNQPSQTRTAIITAKPEQFMCPSCCSSYIDICEKHSKKFIEYKCKFCCSIAQVFYNKCHYCQSCYKMKEYVSKLDRNKLPTCLGEKCPIGGNHYGNGDQRVLRCAACRYGKKF